MMDQEYSRAEIKAAKLHLAALKESVDTPEYQIITKETYIYLLETGLRFDQISWGSEEERQMAEDYMVIALGEFQDLEKAEAKGDLKHAASARGDIDAHTHALDSCIQLQSAPRIEENDEIRNIALYHIKKTLNYRLDSMRFAASALTKEAYRAAENADAYGEAAKLAIQTAKTKWRSEAERELALECVNNILSIALGRMRVVDQQECAPSAMYTGFMQAYQNAFDGLVQMQAIDECLIDRGTIVEGIRKKMMDTLSKVGREDNVIGMGVKPQTGFFSRLDVPPFKDGEASGPVRSSSRPPRSSQSPPIY